MKIVVGFLILVFLSGVFFLPTQFGNGKTANTVSINLFGSASSGWGFTQTSMTSPGPTITVNIGDLVNLTLTGVDSLPHIFFVDYNSDGTPSSGEPKSTTFTHTTINYQFSATTAGTFTYLCQFHPSLMRGTIIVQKPTAKIPPEVTQYSKDWPLPNRDYGNTRFTDDAIINSSNVGNLKLAWSFKIPGVGAYGGGASNPIIMGNNIYFQDLKSNVFSLSMQDGHVNWEKIYNVSAVVGPNGPAVGWGKVFAAKDLYTIAALNASTGEEIWASKISNVNTTGIDIQPSVYDGMVYVSTVPGTADVFYAAGGIGVVYALDQNNGNIMWNFSTVDTPNLWGHPEINSGGGCWYTPAIDVNSGVTFWGIANPAPFPGAQDWPNGSSRPGPNLYTNSMMALYHDNGTMKWFNQVLPHDLFDHDLQIAPILASANVNGSQQDIVIGSGKMGRVYAFNRDTGTLLWQTDVGEHQNDTLTGLPPGSTRVLPGIAGGVETPMAYSVSNGILYVPVINLFSDWNATNFDFSTFDFAQGKGELVAINVSTGNILWSKLFDSINVGAATVVNDLVFTATYDGTIYSFKCTTGEQLFSYKAPAGINGWPAVAGDTIVWPAGVGVNASVIALSVGAPDVAVTNINSPKTVLGEGALTNITVTVANHGGAVSETFNVTLMALGNRTAATAMLTLLGSAFTGWNGTAPGPTITATLRDTVVLNLVSSDSLPHRFFIDYNGDGAPSPGEPTSPTFTSQITYTFVADQTGMFTYHCAFHPNAMLGTFTIRPAPTDFEVGEQTVNPPLAAGEERTLVFTWHALGTVKGNYTWEAVAELVPGETNTVDNNLTVGTVRVALLGDINGIISGSPDGRVDFKDIGMVARLFDISYPDPSYNPNADIFYDGRIDFKDIGTVARQFGQVDP